jgi:hypothetical protein
MTPGEKCHLNHGNGIAYQIAAEVLGVGVGASSSLSSDTQQYHATKAHGYGRHVWSNHGWLFDTSNNNLITFYAATVSR